LVDQVTVLDLDRALIAARYDLSRAEDVFAGHFPGYPVWPAVLQVEAIMQAGVILFAGLSGTSGLARATVVHVNEARFMRPIVPGDDVEIFAHLIEDSLLYTVVGQCLQNGSICSVVSTDLLCEGSDF
jgi:3-hydroxyacyl-[acyl-carrier-protein] dehydratase